MVQNSISTPSPPNQDLFPTPMRVSTIKLGNCWPVIRYACAMTISPHIVCHCIS